MKNKFLEKAKTDVQMAYTRDSYMVQAVRSLDDLDQVKSLLFQRLDEWFKIHFPEMSLANEEHYAWFAAHASDKDVFEKWAQQVGPDKADQIKNQRASSFGAALEKEDQKAISSLAETVLQLCKARKELEQYIETLSGQLMPNATALVGGLISARLLSVAGSMERLATFPASTLQVLGAEKALFKHLKKGTLPPKHGLIFQSPTVNGQPFDKRGKAARALAGKLAIALKADFYTKNDISDKLAADLDKRLKQISLLPARNIQPKNYREIEYQRAREFRGGRSGFYKDGFSSPKQDFRRDGPRDGFRRERGFEHGPKRFDHDRPRKFNHSQFNDRPGFKQKSAHGDQPRFSKKPSFREKRFTDRPGSGDKPRFGDGQGKPFGKKNYQKRREK